MSHIGALFVNNTVVYESNVPPSSIELTESKIKINAGGSVPEVCGLCKEITWRFFPGIPPPPKPVTFVAREYTEWAPNVTVAITGPFGEENHRILKLTGLLDTNQVVTFCEKVDN